MKKLLFHCLFCSLLTSSFATDYQCFQPHRKAYYGSNQMRVVPVWVDSVVNSELFFNRSLQLAGDYCFTEQGAGWLGEKMKIDSVWNYFFTNQGDTIRIKTDAGLNESWILYRKNTMTIEATVTGHDTRTLFGFTDSVKTIRLKVYDATMKPLPHQLEGAEIALSKSRGIVKGMPFFHFPDAIYESVLPEARQIDLIGLTHPTEGDRVLTWREAFDFEPGDEFHYLEETLLFGASGYFVKRQTTYKILNRWESNDRLYYKREVQSLKNTRYVNSAEPEIRYFTGHDTLVVSPNPRFDLEPGIPYYGPNNDYFEIPVDFGFRTTLDFDRYTNENNCWRQGILIDDVCNYTLYAGGRGLVSASSGCWEMWSSWSTNQVYYKKAGVESGEPLVITHIAKTKASTPVIQLRNKMLTIENAPPGATLFVTDLSGRVMLKEQLLSPAATLDIHQLEDGIYLYSLVDQQGYRFEGKLIKNKLY